MTYIRYSIVTKFVIQCKIRQKSHYFFMIIVELQFQGNSIGIFTF